MLIIFAKNILMYLYKVAAKGRGKVGKCEGGSMKWARGPTLQMSTLQSCCYNIFTKKQHFSYQFRLDLITVYYKQSQICVFTAICSGI